MSKFDLDIVEKARQRQKELQEIQERALRQSIKEDANRELLDMVQNRKKLEIARNNAPLVIKEALLYSFIDKVYTCALECMNIQDSNGIRYNMINDYIKENGTLNIINKFQKNSEYLSEVAYQINSRTRSIIEAADDIKIIDVTVTDDEKNKFIDSVDFGSIDQLSKKIADRVQQAQVEFIDFNEKDSKQIENIINVTQEKVNSTVKESLIELYESDCKAAINMVKCRNKSILEVMVNEICKKTYNNDIIKEQFTENSKLNLDKILETATIMYTFLEMCNTAKFENINEEYITNIYKELTSSK